MTKLYSQHSSKYCISCAVVEVPWYSGVTARLIFASQNLAKISTSIYVYFCLTTICSPGILTQFVTEFGTVQLFYKKPFLYVGLPWRFAKPCPVINRIAVQVDVHIFIGENNGSGTKLILYHNHMMVEPFLYVYMCVPSVNDIHITIFIIFISQMSLEELIFFFFIHMSVPFNNPLSFLSNE